MFSFEDFRSGATQLHLTNEIETATMAAEQPIEKTGDGRNCQDAKYGPRRNCLNRVLPEMSRGLSAAGLSRRDP